MEKVHSGPPIDNSISSMEEKVKDVVKFCQAIGRTCTPWQAKEALRGHRGYGDPQRALCWLLYEGGVEILDRQKSKGDTHQKPSSDRSKNSVDGAGEDGKGEVFQEGASTEVEILSKQDLEEHFEAFASLEEHLLSFAKENGIHENVAKNACLRVSSFSAGCEWMLTHPQEDKEPATAAPSHGHNIFCDTAIHEQRADRSTASSAALSTNGDRRSTWTCSGCTLVNDVSALHCEACTDPSPLRLQAMEFEEKLSKLKAEAISTAEQLEAHKAEQAENADQLRRLAGGFDVPSYWKQFPDGNTTLEVEILHANGSGAEERDRIIDMFLKGGIGIGRNRIVSLKRIQNLSLWLRYASQKALVAEKPSNKGNPNVKYLFHGPKRNTEAIIKNGFVGQYGVSQPYGTWTHTSSQYSGGSFADTSPPGGGRRIFICQAAVGTPGQDNGSGRRPNDVMPGVLADCHQNGGIHVFYVDSQLYPEYLIQWR